MIKRTALALALLLVSCEAIKLESQTSFMDNLKKKVKKAAPKVEVPKVEVPKVADIVPVEIPTEVPTAASLAAAAPVSIPTDATQLVAAAPV